MCIRDRYYNDHTSKDCTRQATFVILSHALLFCDLVVVADPFALVALFVNGLLFTESNYAESFHLVLAQVFEGFLHNWLGLGQQVFVLFYLAALWELGGLHD